MGKLFNFAVQLDVLSAVAIAAGVAAAILIYIFFGWVRMEDGLRSRRSPNQVRMEAAAVGIVIGAALPCLASAWGFGVFLVFLVIAAIVALWGRSSWLGWLALGIGLALVLAVVALKPAPAIPKGGATFNATPPVQAAPSPAAPEPAPPKPATPEPAAPTLAPAAQPNTASPAK